LPLIQFNVNFRDCLYNYVDHVNPLFPCDHGAATHSCIMHEVGRGMVCKNASQHWHFFASDE